MSELSVVDVQRILREHAKHGHDILTDPRTVYFGDMMSPDKEPSPFGIPLAHHLYIRGDSTSSELRSEVMHGEQPTGTVVNSWLNHGPSASELTYRDAVKIHPFYDRGGSGFTSFPHDEKDNTLPTGNFPQDEHVYGGNIGPEGSPQATHDDFHAVLHNHANSPALYTFADKEHSEYHNTGGWDLKTALEHQAFPLKPFSGLVHITFGNYGRKQTKWVYNPRTEQMQQL